MVTRLKDAEVESRMRSIPAWKRTGDLIEREFTFPDFVAAMRFVNRVAEEAERSQHHPDIHVLYNRVRLGYSTHDAGGLSERDFTAAVAVDRIAAG
ncbi:MAG: 4a-hydroxytetrahydrobiopterin dehydratase [Planctomycetes bacterium]|nr:4a-hydroxytetrahydrobiopterin dehydratase [Planctomycetota bacterium]